ncbi:MAG: phenylalanine--tRNA ligase subunit beta [Deltaproteobacteria bacterium]|nr:phenylalanine--tRNA ligase subunit beta [Deltaproteobacteria bacterium]
MKVSLNWLREFVTIDLSVDQLASRLAMAGLEVDDIRELGITPIHIAQIVSVDPHPQSDHLTICRVTTGRETFAVVCGAPNVTVGAKVALASVGTTLPGGQHVELAEIRGQRSHGMLCSERELGLSDDHSGLLILAADAPIGEKLYDHIGLRDTILDVAITANRGDCLSVLGLAREIAALTGVPLLAQRPRVKESKTPIGDQIRVSIPDPDLCPRYAARVVSNLRVAPSPAWMRWRLEAAGVRAINNIVDVTNYVMLERGQPLHAFDLPSVHGPEIIVRRARDIATVTTLDGKERTLVADDLLICDQDRAVAVAGVMGGSNSEVHDQTTVTLLESAYFVPETVRRTARRLGLRSEASYRFERGIDPQGTILALDRAASLLVQIAEGQVSRGVIDVCPQPLVPTTITLRGQRVSNFLGMPIEARDVEHCLQTLGAKVKRSRGGTWSVTVPSYRADLTQEADLIEEVARLRGYETIPTLLPRTEAHEKNRDHEGEWGRRIRFCLASQGLSEMMSLSFTSAQLNRLFAGTQSAVPIPLINPLSAEGAEMRVSLLGNVMRVLQHNLRQGESGVTMFELGKVFFGGQETPDGRQERLHVAGVLYGNWPASGLQKPAPIEFPDLKGVLEALFQDLHCEEQIRWERAAKVPFLHPGKAAAILVDGTVCGVVGAVHPDHCRALYLTATPWVFEIDLAPLLLQVRTAVRYQQLPRFPTTVRDVALVADDTLPVQVVIDAVRSLGNPLIVDMRLFDQYRGSPIPQNKQSLAYSIAYRAADRTLTALEVNEVHSQVIAHLAQALNVEVRA